MKKKLNYGLLDNMAFVEGKGEGKAESCCILSAAHLLLGYEGRNDKMYFMDWQRREEREETIDCCCPAVEGLAMIINDEAFQEDDDTHGSTERKLWALETIPKLIDSYAGPVVTIHRLLTMRAQWINKLGGAAEGFQKVTTPTLGEVEHIFCPINRKGASDEWRVLRNEYLNMHSHHFGSAFRFIKETLQIQETLNSLMDISAIHSTWVLSRENFGWQPTGFEEPHNYNTCAALLLAQTLAWERFGLTPSTGETFVPFADRKLFAGDYTQLQRRTSLRICNATVRHHRLAFPNDYWARWMGLVDKDAPNSQALGKLGTELLEKYSMSCAQRIDWCKDLLEKWAVPATSA